MDANMRRMERGRTCCHLTPSAGEPEAVGVVGHLVEVGEAVGVDDGVAGVVVVAEALGAVGAALLPVVVEAERGCGGGCTGGCEGRWDVGRDTVDGRWVRVRYRRGARARGL